ncbi:hypothetical protein ACP4OV_014753 [Aristida adscensionis]
MDGWMFCFFRPPWWKGHLLLLINRYVRKTRDLALEREIADPDHKSLDGLGLAETRFVDLSAPYTQRLRDLSSFLKLDVQDISDKLRDHLTTSFLMIYTNFKMVISIPGFLLIFLLPSMSLASAVLFGKTPKDGYNENDVKVTYIVLWCTTLLGVLQFLASPCCWGAYIFLTTAAQHNLISFSARRIKPTKLMKFLGIMGFSDYINKHCYIEKEGEPSCLEVINFVVEHVKNGWKHYIVDGASYKRFNNLRGQWTMARSNICNSQLLWSFWVPFDQSILVWHVATELCLHHPKTSTADVPDRQSSARRCSKVISNYMIYLLLIRPEMLLPGSRQGIFTVTSDDIEVMLKHANGPPLLDRRSITERILRAAQTSPSPNAGYIGIWTLKACKLAEDLMELLGDEERWEVIRDVWVEMLCYSAGRCRGYLHAKSMGEGVEFLTFIWLLLSQMGMQTLADMFQRAEPTEFEEIDASNSVSESQDMPI